MRTPHTPYPLLDPTAVLWSSRLLAESDLLIMMHGWSYDERHLFALRDEFPEDLVIASVRAPIPEAGGYAWFPSVGNPIGDPQPAVANAAADVVLDWYDSLPTPRSVGLLGFSQGGAMVLQMMRRRPGAFAYGVQLGGFVVNDTQPGDEALRSERPPVFWGRGAHDAVIPAAAVRRTAMFSTQHLSITERVYPDLGHDVAGREVTDLAAFVTDQIARR
ncbi:alpha/beta hydrolase [Curtobacterium flaccumfaciens]|uniref:alpha/beta hydrolase n=1 Tax=Curtobacterium flaccumfaciens TaxID=2035 RepID=UPI0012669260|nr:dienelactone hydrolase family protein [Curtobacterium flaccumfaciens]MBT1664949.1 dienelactone hydrolase family protein [Curtobacterium flaccumfaciens pv. flaccumfaciens]QFS79413.1 phospholipase [Curtobacterium flaccumfaciens pv. flaccumfaciens]